MQYIIRGNNTDSIKEYIESNPGLDIYEGLSKRDARAVECFCIGL